LDTPDNATGGPGVGVRHRDSAGRRQGHASHGSDTSVYGGFSPSPPPLALLSLAPQLAGGLAEGEGDSQDQCHSSGVLVTRAPGPVSVSVHRTVELPDVSEQQGQGVEGGNEVSPSIFDLTGNPSDTNGVGPVGYPRLRGESP